MQGPSRYNGGTKGTDREHTRAELFMYVVIAQSASARDRGVLQTDSRPHER